MLGPCRYLQARFGYRLTVVPVDGHGVVDPDDVARAIEPGTVLITVMHANNEVGTLQPIADIARLAHERGITVHSDAAQSVGKVAVDVDALGVDLLTVAGHKTYAPKGIGALYVRPGIRLEPLVHGGGQEREIRAGTENVPYVAGLGAACALAGRRLQAGAPLQVMGLRDRLHAALRSAVPGLVVSGHPESAVRLSLGYDTTTADVDAAAACLIAAAAPPLEQLVRQLGEEIAT